MLPRIPSTRLLAVVVATVGSILGTSKVAAQVVFDGSLGAGGTLSGNIVPADRGTAAGANLFHSFSNFNVGPGHSVYFEAPQVTQNVLARVTGSSASTIEGTLGVQGSLGAPSAANLFLINPNGILFGKGATLDVAGSFSATTADYLSFRDDAGAELGRFYASGNGNVSILTPPPSAFGFLESPSSGTIKIQLDNINERSQFSKGNVALIGRNLDLRNSYLFHEKGGLTLQALSQGEITPGASLSSEASSLQASAVSLTNVFIDAPSGRKIQIESQGKLTLKDGTLDSVTRNEGTENHGQITLQAATDLAIDHFTIAVINRGTGDGGAVTVNAGGDLIITNAGQIRTGYTAGGSGPGILVSTGGSLRIDRFGLINSDSRTAGSGGAITLAISGSTVIEDFGLILSSAAGDATGGKITLNTADLLVRGPAEVKPADQMDAQGRTSGIESTTEGNGRGGSIEVNVTGDARLQNSGGIFTSTDGLGTSGSIYLKAANLEIMGIRNFMPDEGDMRPKGFFVTGISNKRARNNFTGSLGSIEVEVAGNISLVEGGLIDASNFSLNSDAVSGDVKVTAENIFADRDDSDYFTGIGSGTIADESLDVTDGGRGGTVSVTAHTIELRNGAQIAASSRSGGDAGLVEVFTNHLTATGSGPVTPFVFTGESGVVSSTRGSATGDAGGVYIGEMVDLNGMSTRPLIQLSHKAEIGARADGSGDGGSVVIDFPNGTVTLDTGSNITARSGIQEGSAGSVSVTADRLIIKDSVISSTNAALQSIGGDAGNVELYPNVLILDGGRLQVSAAGGNAGSLKIEGARLLDVRNSEVVAEAFLDGGSIMISDTVALLLDNSLLSANAINGAGGNIDISAQVFLSNQAIVTASSQFGVDGVVQIDRSIALTGAETRLEVNALDATEQIQPECTQRLKTEVGSFIRTGRGGSARLPGSYLPSVRLHRTN